MEMTATDRINRDTTPWRPAKNAAEDAHRAGNREEPPAGRTTAVEWSDLVAGTLLIVTAFLFWWLSAAHASAMPLWAPWDFSWVEFVSTWLVIWWFARGLVRTEAPNRPSPIQRIGFLAGTLAIYSVLQTHFEYAAQHMFVLNRIQHVVMHHLGPLLIALSWPGATIAHGMPRTLRALARHHLVLRAVNLVQQPILAATLFVGIIFFWLIPAVHFRAMLDPRLFAIMNWSMVVDGILFWCLVLDPRPSPPARTSFAVRAMLAIGVMFPQILGGALIAFSRRDLYPSYDLCGRLFPGIGALADQTLGGLVIWIPPAMMSVLALILVLNASRRYSEAQQESSGHARLCSTSIEARLWTG
ncbi:MULTISPECIES: cytochrome c oxidase assembly protein [unclassified Bradyrhizobium]|uniref:cytochrome c oxidase assembly protein n=1 Tax=unclassified Bradyrhizobium TaxID=2631580 RepID=UPI00247958AF|nr:MULTISPECIES: cytochrome c oxidase assembly protein [unclassified Bradyrhizobium]WGS20573.1 cytochrome c oxidase assembly protein [Bradyrhizobium sp. ISRA463]WGS27459.1 cytochrome c oxidase assembly protein [Bradyrhizobium sp. ISRA464]